jgi:hypothetical protein
MKNVVLAVFGVLALAAQTNAQGKWYTNRADWLLHVTNVRTAEYTSSKNSSLPIEENGVTATKTGSSNLVTNGTFLTASGNDIPITFTFSGNAFFGEFNTRIANGSIVFSIDGSLTNIYTLTNLTGSSTKFLGYISNSGSDISVKLTPNSENRVRVQSFSAGQSVAPEPGTLALALTGGCALVGMYIRRRRMSN